MLFRSAQSAVGSTRESEAALQRATTLAERNLAKNHPIAFNVWMTDARIALAQGNGAKAQSAAQRLVDAPEAARWHVEALSVMGAAAVMNGDTQAATRALDALRERAGVGAATEQASARLAEARLSAQLGLVDRALTSADQGLQLLEGFEEHPLRGHLRLVRAQALTESEIGRAHV